MQVEQKPVGYLGSALVGMAFGAGWTPCIGPVLGAILGLAATSQDLGRGMLLLALSGHGASDDAKRSAEHGFDYHLVKPVDPDRLTRLITQGLSAA